MFRDDASQHHQFELPSYLPSCRGIDMNHQIYNMVCRSVLCRNPLSLSCLLVFVLLILPGCGLRQDISLIDHNQAPILTSIQITPSDIDLPFGLTQQFTATGSFSDGSTQDLTSLARWVSSSPHVANINSNGLAMTVGVGTSSITAAAG